MVKEETTAMATTHKMMPILSLLSVLEFAEEETLDVMLTLPRNSTTHQLAFSPFRCHQEQEEQQ